MAYVTIEKYIDVEVDLEEFETEELVEELERRGESTLGGYVSTDLLKAIWQKRRLGQDYQRELDDLIYNGLDRIVQNPGVPSPLFQGGNWYNHNTWVDDTTLRPVAVP